MKAALALAAAACSSGGGAGGDTGIAQGTGGNGGAGTSSSSAGALASVGAGGFGGGSMPFACDPPPAPGSLYEKSAVSYDIDAIDPVSMCKYRGDVLLIANTAAL